MVLSWLILRSNALPSSAGYLGLLSGVLLILLHIAYLTILSALNPLVLFLVLLSGFIQPVWYIWIGWLLYQREARLPHRAAAMKGR